MVDLSKDIQLMSTLLRSGLCDLSLTSPTDNIDMSQVTLCKKNKNKNKQNKKNQKTNKNKQTTTTTTNYKQTKKQKNMHH